MGIIQENNHNLGLFSKLPTRHTLSGLRRAADFVVAGIIIRESELFSRRAEMKRYFYRFCVVWLIPWMTILNCPLPSLAASTPSLSMKIQHNPVEEVTAGARIGLEAVVIDDSGVEVVRVYFRAAEAADYNFVSLSSTDNETFTGTLPAPENHSGSFHYLILVKNGNNQVVKTETFTVAVKNNDNAEAAAAENEPITVYTELQQVPAGIPGFNDNLVVDAIESSAKLGVVAGLYSSSAGTSTSGAVAAGTVTTSTTFSTSLIIAGVIAAGAVAGVAASGGGSGRGSGGGSEGGSDGGADSNDSVPTETSCSFTGNWYGNYSEIDCFGDAYNESWTGTVDAQCFFKGVAVEGFLSGQVDPATGSASLTGYDDVCGSISGSALFSGSSVSGSYSGSGSVGSFTGSRQ